MWSNPAANQPAEETARSTGATDMIAFSGQEAQVSTKIWVDVNDLAALIDGDNSVEYLTLGAAVVARDNLPADRINGAKIKCGARIFTADEIDRLYHKPASRKQ